MMTMREMLRRHPNVIRKIYPVYMFGIATYVALGLTFGWFR